MAPDGDEAIDTDGVTTGFTVTVSVEAVLVPQLFDAVTEIVPPVLPAVTLIVFVEELPVQPLGSVQV
jgi:hypothetical protein